MWPFVAALRYIELLSAIERGERKPTLETFYRIGEALHMRPSAVLAEIEAELEKAQKPI